MPGFDGTGPRGMGPMTGGGRGRCNPRGLGLGWGSGIGLGRGWGRGIGRGRGMGLGRGFGWSSDTPFYGGYSPWQDWAHPWASPYAPQMTKEEELDFLKDQAGVLGEQLQQMQKRVEELEKA